VHNDSTVSRGFKQVVLNDKMMSAGTMTAGVVLDDSTVSMGPVLNDSTASRGLYSMNDTVSKSDEIAVSRSNASTVARE
jgi:hypothetical protein